MELAVPILFYCLAVMAVTGGVGVLVFRRPVHAARSLIFTIAVAAVLFLLRHAVLLAVVHALLACAGFFFLQRFVTVRPAALDSGSRPMFVPELAPLAIVAGVLFGVIASLGLILGVPAPGQGDGTALRSVNGEEWGNITALASAVVTVYLIPLLVVLVTLIVAVCGAGRMMGGRWVFASEDEEAGR